MKNSNKLKIILLSLFMLFLYGCVQQSNLLPYIEPITQKQDIASIRETYSLKFFVVNPTPNTFVGTLKYKYNQSCLITKNSLDIDNVEVTPNNKLAYSKEFKFKNVDEYGTLRDEYNRMVDTSECLQKPLQISVLLYDKGGDFRGSSDFLVTFTK